jgi:hypothetical protein
MSEVNHHKWITKTSHLFNYLFKFNYFKAFKTIVYTYMHIIENCLRSTHLKMRNSKLISIYSLHQQIFKLKSYVWNWDCLNNKLLILDSRWSIGANFRRDPVRFRLVQGLVDHRTIVERNLNNLLFINFIALF